MISPSKYYGAVIDVKHATCEVGVFVQARYLGVLLHPSYTFKNVYF